jgi:hypothetical protein
MYQNRTTVLSIILLILCACSSEKPPTAYPVSTSTYDELNQEIGCDSKYVEDKKIDIFNSSYLNHWMTWKGQILKANSEEASLNLDGKGIQDLHITFADSKGGYDLLLDDVITVKFLMKSAGGCILPFEGVQAVVVRDTNSL